MRSDALPAEARFAYIWEYEVHPHAIDAFEAAYGPQGDWARLFRRHSGYIATHLLRDRSVARRYRTIDYWQSKAAHAELRHHLAAELEALDRACESLTTWERHVGDYDDLP